MVFCSHLIFQHLCYILFYTGFTVPSLCPVSRVCVGELSLYGEETLRNIRDFLDITFAIERDKLTGTVTLVGDGCELRSCPENFRDKRPLTIL